MYRIEQIVKQYNLLEYEYSMHALEYTMASINKLNLTECLCAQNDD